MGNQIVCPSGNSWYLHDFEKLGYVVERSLYDGTFLLSFLVSSKKPNSQYVVKAYKIPEDSPEFCVSHKESIEKIQEFQSIIKRMQSKNQLLFRGNIISTEHVYSTSAYLVRPYIHASLQTRMTEFPYLKPIESDWIAFQILKSIQSLQMQGFYHGDIKPENFLVSNRLQVFLVDHSPFKPFFLKSKKPNYFIHFFSYGGGCSYIAPERIVENEVAKEINMESSDLFSIGCVLAYLYLNGVHLFNFSTVQDYAHGNVSYLSKLDSISNLKVRELIINLLSTSPSKRIKAFEGFQTAYPSWFGNFYETFYQEGLGYCLVEKMVSVHDNIMGYLPPDIGSDSIIYFNIISDVILSSGRAISLKILIDHIVTIAINHFDDSMKLTHAIPPLFELLERNSHVSSVWALEGIYTVLSSISSISIEFQNYHTAFLLPRLATVMKDDRATFFLSSLPSWSHSMSRLWPSFYADLMGEVALFQYLFTVGMEASAVSKTNSLRIGFIRSYLRNCEKSSIFKSFALLNTLCFYALPLMRNDAFIYEIIGLILSFFEQLGQEGILQFQQYLLEPFFAALFSTDISATNAPKNFIALGKLIHSGLIIHPHFCSQIADIVFQFIPNSPPSMKYSSMYLMKQLPEFYQQLWDAIRIKSRISDKPAIDYVPKTRKKSFTEMINQKNEVKASARQKTGSLSRLRAFTIGMFSSNNNNNEIQRSGCSFFVGTKVSEKGIHSAYFENDNTLVVHHSQKYISSISLSIEDSIRTKSKILFDKSQQIFSFQKLVSNNESLFAFSDKDGIMVFGNSRKEHFPINERVSLISKLSDQYFLSKTHLSNTIEMRSINSIQVCSQLTMKSEVGLIEPWENTPLILSSDVFGNLYIYDTRTSFPVFRKAYSSPRSIMTIPDSKELNFVVFTNESVEIYDPQSQLSIAKFDNPFDSGIIDQGNLFLLDQCSTLSIDLLKYDNCYSYFDKSVIQRIPVMKNEPFNTSFIKTPQEISMSLHGHNFPVTSIDKRNGIFASGDTNGYIHFWSPINKTIN